MKLNSFLTCNLFVEFLLLKDAFTKIFCSTLCILILEIIQVVFTVLVKILSLLLVSVFNWLCLGVFWWLYYCLVLRFWYCYKWNDELCFLSIISILLYLWPCHFFLSILSWNLYNYNCKCYLVFRVLHVKICFWLNLILKFDKFCMLVLYCVFWQCVVLVF